jgi:hypothetical protein
VEPGPLLLRLFIGLLYQPWMIDGDDCGAISGMSGRGNRRNRRRPASGPFCESQIPHDLTRAQTLAAAVRNRRLTDRAAARPVQGLITQPTRAHFSLVFNGRKESGRAGTQLVLCREQERSWSYVESRNAAGPMSRAGMLGATSPPLGRAQLQHQATSRVKTDATAELTQ